MKIKDKAGATALFDASGLIPKHISTVGALNEWEAQNILKATSQFVYGSRLSMKGWLTLDFIKKFINESLMRLASGLESWHQLNEEVKNSVVLVKHVKSAMKIMLFQMRLCFIIA